MFGFQIPISLLLFAQSISDLENTINDLREQLSSAQEKTKMLDRAKLRVDTLLQQEKTQGENRITDLQGEFFVVYFPMQ